MTKKDWIVKRWGYTQFGKKYGVNIPYPYWVGGTLPDGSSFFWIVPGDLDNERYDFSEAVWCDDVKQYNLEKRLVIL